MKFQAILFDFDGVLASSEDLHHKTFDLALRTLGETLAAEEYLARYIHGDDESVFRMLSRDRNLGWNEERVKVLGVRKRALFMQELQDRDLLYPGAAGLVRRLSAQVPLAVVSMADRPLIEHVLRRGGIAACFQTVISANDVTRPKPDPQPYRMGLEGLNRQRTGQAPLAARACLAVEDSCGGVRAGKAAGMSVLALTHTAPAETLRAAGADEVLASLEALQRWWS